MQLEFAMQEGQSDQISDIAIASAVAHAVRAAPGVIDLSPGTTALAATYGSGKRVDGVVVHHLAPDKVALEIHVTLSETACKQADADAALETSGRVQEEQGLLTRVASRIRSAVYDIAPGMAPQALMRVDVYIDDLR
jgi:hypothetical protein